MRYLSKIFFLIMILSALVAFTACSSGGDDDDDDDAAVDDTMGDDDFTDDATDDVADDTGDDVADDTGDDVADDTEDDDTEDDDTGDDDTTPTTTTTTVPTTTTTTTTTSAATIFSIDFEDYTIGALGAPWTILFQAGTSTGNVVTLSKAGSGKGLEVSGGTTDSDYWGAMYTFTDTSASMSMAYDVRCAASAAMGFRFFQNYSGSPFSEFTIYSDPTTGHIMASNPAGTWADCGALAAATWTNIEYDVDYAGGTYTVLLNGTPVVACTDLALDWGDGTPFGSFMVADFSDPGFGGVCDYDNFVGELL